MWQSKELFKSIFSLTHIYWKKVQPTFIDIFKSIAWGNIQINRKVLGKCQYMQAIGDCSIKNEIIKKWLIFSEKASYLNQFWSFIREAYWSVVKDCGFLKIAHFWASLIFHCTVSIHNCIITFYTFSNSPSLDLLLTYSKLR